MGWVEENTGHNSNKNNGDKSSLIKNNKHAIKFGSNCFLTFNIYRGRLIIERYYRGEITGVNGVVFLRFLSILMSTNYKVKSPDLMKIIHILLNSNIHNYLTFNLDRVRLHVRQYCIRS